MLWKKKNSESTEKKDDITRLLIPSILGICLCVACLLGSTFAWFSASVTMPSSVIQAADYNVDVAISRNGGEQLSPSADGSFELSLGTYEVSLTASGSTMNGGYCILTFNGSQKVHTVNILSGENLSFELVISDGSEAVTAEETTLISEENAEPEETAVDEQATVPEETDTEPEVTVYTAEPTATVVVNVRVTSQWGSSAQKNKIDHQRYTYICETETKE